VGNQLSLDAAGVRVKSGVLVRITPEPARIKPDILAALCDIICVQIFICRSTVGIFQNYNMQEYVVTH
jgi:hypothetical protein